MIRKNQEYIEILCAVLADSKTVGKNKFIGNVIRQALTNPAIPTEAQRIILDPMIQKWRQRRKEKLLQDVCG